MLRIKHNKLRLSKSVALITTTILTLATTVLGWADKPHSRISQAAFDCQPQELRQLWSSPHKYPFDPRGPHPIAEYLVAYKWWSGNPDFFMSGPLDRARHIGNFLYAENKNAQQCKPTPPGAGKPAHEWIYHYFVFDPDKNFARAQRGARWYFQQMVDAFKDNRPADAAQFAATLAHAVEDRSSPVHAWDGYSSQREAFETKHADQGLQDPNKSFRNNPKSWSLFWFNTDESIHVDISDYKPKMLGTTIDEAAAAFAKRLQEITDASRANLADPDRFLGAHLKDDWPNRSSSPKTTSYMEQMAKNSARLVADVFYTAYRLQSPPSQR